VGKNEKKIKPVMPLGFLDECMPFHSDLEEKKNLDKMSWTMKWALDSQLARVMCP
jgi:hypothetical protein